MFSKELKQAVNRTWQAIGSDIVACAEECGEEVDNESAVECCIDADRIVVYGGEGAAEAQREFRARVAVVGYSVALRELARSLPCPLM